MEKLTSLPLKSLSPRELSKNQTYIIMPSFRGFRCDFPDCPPKTLTNRKYL